MEGDNLHSLKLLEKTHRSQIDLIYIDPPYNTGNKDFIYDDHIVDKTDGYSHSKWLSFMNKRLAVAKNLLSPQGVIFISIDDNEQAQLKLLCDEIFGEQNFLAQIVWERAYSPVNLKKHFSESHDFILVYAKNKELTISNKLKRSEEANNRYKNPDNDPRGVWKTSDLSVGPAVESNIYPITTPTGKIVYPPQGRSWVYSQERFYEMLEDKRIWFGSKNNSIPQTKRFLSEVNQSVVPMTIWKYSEVDHSQTATKELKEIFGGQALFTYPKPVKLIKQCISLYSQSNSIILDFFAGSGTTGHAVAQLNKEDGGNRTYILCTNNENNICEEVTYQRLKNIQTDLPHNLKYLKTDFIQKFAENDRTLRNQLLPYIRPLIELDFGCEIDHQTVFLLENEEQLAEILTENITEKSTLFITSDILFSRRQNALVAAKKIRVIEIPEYYFRQELVEMGEL
ncbi:MAG: DNA methyltransferase [Pasteurella oralis]|uniref:site-specific DNA-methyltransferase n=1 Tax=Pasteurella oralis TaxID=1071947 RepID=UPI001FE3C436|nr:DNA methyltransferase [Pasteurella oralis]MDO5055305.1 DNA methyltransferase [Pasteurella oralis]